METTFTRSTSAERTRRTSVRSKVVSLLGPATIAAGIVWAILQPYRLTLLHPVGEGFWWLVFEPQLLVAIVGIAFSFVVARPLLDDLEEADASAR
ncbi:MAG TPA: hypothetical protein VIJ70_12440 [Gaiellaceae bacterium]